MNLSVQSEKPDLGHDFEIQTTSINILNTKTLINSLKYLPVITSFFLGGWGRGVGSGGFRVIEYIFEKKLQKE